MLKFKRKFRRLKVKWTRPFRRKPKSGLCARAITFQLARITPWPLYPWERDPLPIVQRAGWTMEPASMSPENLASTGIRTADRPACSKSQYRPSSDSSWPSTECMKRKTEHCNFTLPWVFRVTWALRFSLSYPEGSDSSFPKCCLPISLMLSGAHNSVYQYN